jgi:hypothetical protein
VSVSDNSVRRCKQTTYISINGSRNQEVSQA